MGWTGMLWEMGEWEMGEHPSRHLDRGAEA